MFVLADIEWISNEKNDRQFLTQIAALKVDKQWNVTDEFNAFVKPYNIEFHDWGHIACTGGTASDFSHANGAYTVLDAFEKWLDNEDVLLWWSTDSIAVFKRMNRIILKKEDKHKAVAVNGYIYEHLYGQPQTRGGVYKIAAAREIDTNPELEHNSFNDVTVMQKLMSKLCFPQDVLLKPFIKKIRKPQQNKVTARMPLQYDPLTNTVHLKECELLSSGKIATQGYEMWKTVIRKKCRPCDCCKEEYRAVIKERNTDILKRTKYLYVYTPNSKVFHKPSCGMILFSREILGTPSYDKAVKSGRTPCKLCKPTRWDYYISLPIEKKLALRQKSIKKYANPTDKRAIARQQVAIEERKRLLENENLTQAEIADIYTLTQPRFAFWAGKGCRTFHLRSCSKLHNTGDLQGFETYEEALHAGYRPCRICKPTDKHDAIVSIPITNRVRLNESVSDVLTLCEKAGFSAKREEKIVLIETPVGKWKIDTTKVPVKLSHINLAIDPACKKYHEQPRIFLSFADTFDYIKKHDEQLERNIKEGTTFNHDKKKIKLY